MKNDVRTTIAILAGIVLSIMNCGHALAQEKSVMMDGSVKVTIMMNEYYFPYDLSSDGSQVAIASWGMGYSYCWSSDEGLVEIPEGTVKTVADNGILAGTFVDPEIGGEAGGIWNPETQEWISLGVNPDFPTGSESYNDIWGMSKDGSVLVGMQINEDWTSCAFQWTAENGFDNFGLELESSTKASGISGNGEVIFGWIDDDYLWQPTIWVDGEYTILAPGEYGNLMCSSYEGDILAGENDYGAFYWTEESGIVNFGEYGYVPTHVSNDSLVFGFIGVYPPDARQAFVYDIVEDQIMSFNDYAASMGMENAGDWSFYSINKGNRDGSKFIGAGVTPEGTSVSFVVEFPQPVTLTLEADPAEAGEVAGAGEFLPGDTARISAVANQDFEFIHWIDQNDEVISTDVETEIIMSDDLFVKAHFESTIGLGSNRLQAPSIYPNPVADQLNIKNVNGTYDVAIINLDGKAIHYTQATSGSLRIDTKDFLSGVYILQIRTKKQVFSYKITVL